MENFVPLEKRPEWSDVTPLYIDEATETPVCRICYTDECMDKFYLKISFSFFFLFFLFLSFLLSFLLSFSFFLLLLFLLKTDIFIL